MSQHFLGFIPTTGVYKQAIRPHQKWTESTDMSPLIEIDGKDFRIIRVTGKIFRRGAAKNIFLCDSTGNIIDDKQLYRKGFDVYYLLYKLGTEVENLIDSEDKTLTLRMKRMKEILNKLADSLYDELTKAEKIVMQEQLDYIESNIKLSIELEEKAEELLSVIEQLLENKIDRLTVSLVEQWNHQFFQFELYNTRLELLTLDNGRANRAEFKDIVHNPSTLVHFPDRDLYAIINEYIKRMDRSEEKFQYHGELDWGQMAAIDPNKGEFHLETYLKEAWEGEYIKGMSSNYQDKVFAELLKRNA